MQRVGIFNVRIVHKGEHYGMRDCLTHDDSRPMIEFYDSRHPGDMPERGQFVSRYYLETIEEHAKRHAGQGLCLDGGVPDWTIDAIELRCSLVYARRVAARGAFS